MPEGRKVKVFRNMPEPWIMHVDMDAFFASVEQNDNPALQGRPVIVGGESRGVVAAASYEARAFGVYSAMPVLRAKRLCPQAVIVTPRKKRYVQVSALVMQCIEQVSPVVEKASVDEAYADITGAERLGSPLDIALELQKSIKQTTNLSCSIGIAPIKFLAKIASDMRKPGGITIINHHEVQGVLAAMPVEKIPGVGPKAKATLARYGVRTAGDMLQHDTKFWRNVLGERGEFLYLRAKGADKAKVTPYVEEKSIGAENTLVEDTRDKKELLGWLMVHAERVGRELRAKGKHAGTVTLKIKYADFSLLTRAKTLDEATSSTRILYETGFRLFHALEMRKKVRLIGLTASHFKPRQTQLSLFEANDGSQSSQQDKALDKAIDAVQEKFGKKNLMRGQIFELKSQSK